MLQLEDMAAKMAKVFIAMISNYETLHLNVEDGLGVLTINRPSKLNALNIQVLRELKSALKELLSAPLRGLILTGEGEKAFIAGADIVEMMPMTESEAKAFSELGHQVTLGIESLSYPTIACVNGFALGGGFEMALACDFIFATKNAIFALPEVKLGLIPGFGGTQRLSRVVGERRAKEIMLSGRNVTAQEAQSLGIALEVFADKSQLLEEARNWFQVAKNNSPLAIATAKATLRAGVDHDLVKGLEIEAQAFSKIFQTPEMKEGTSAFVEKRKAQFN
jgi:enoyl-CoA hydratase